MSPITSVAVMGRNIGRRKPRSRVGDLDAASKTPGISTGAGTFEGDHEIRIAAAVRSPAELHVSEEHHSRRPPIFERIWENVGIHKRAPGLARTELPYLTPSMAKTEGGLPGIHTYTEKFKLEDGLQIPKSCGGGRLDPETALAHSGVKVPVFPEFVLECRQLGWANHIEPLRIIGPCVEAHIELRRPVDLHGPEILFLILFFGRSSLYGRLGGLLWRRRSGGGHLRLERLQFLFKLIDPLSEILLVRSLRHRENRGGEENAQKQECARHQETPLLARSLGVKDRQTNCQ